MTSDAVPESIFAQLSKFAGNSRIAVTDGAESLNYTDLCALISRFAQELEAHSVGPGDRVALLLGNSIAFLVAAFAIWKRNGIVVLLSPEYRKEEVERYIEQTKATSLIVADDQESLATEYYDGRCGLVHVWKIASNGILWNSRHFDTACEAVTNRDRLATRDSPAVCHLSTGSTGRPKLVVRSQGQLLGEARAMTDVHSIESGDLVIGAVPLFHGYGLGCAVLLALLNGATLHILPRYSPDALGSRIESAGITAFPGVPFMFQHLVESRNKRDLSTLRYATSSGVALAPQIANSFKERYGREVKIQYGTSETGPVTVSTQAEYSHDGQVVGVPIPGVSVEIIHTAESNNDHGLVSIASPYAAERYESCEPGADSYFVGRRFVPGDLGRILPDGRLVLAGRSRKFINVGGQKVDPQEVENTLRAMPEIDDVVVLGAVESSIGEIVKAIVVSRAEIPKASIMAHCRERLAAYKHPAVITFLEELPRNRMGKILRKYLI